MHGPNLHDFVESHAKKGLTNIHLNLYPRKERQFLNEGFSVQRLAPVEEYPKQHTCNVDWSQAVPGAIAHKFLELAASVRPELLQQVEEGVRDPVPPPYAYGYPGFEGK